MKLVHLIEQFRLHLKKQGYSPNTIKKRCGHLGDLVISLAEMGIHDVSEVTCESVRFYYRDIYWRISSRGKPYSPSTVSIKVYALRSFFRYLLAENHILTNPALQLKSPKISRIPRNILSLTEVKALLSQPDLKTFEGLRDRAMLELFYSTGIRRRELVNLDIYDIDIQEDTLFIRHGKGAKDRVVPLGRWAIVYLKRYLEERKTIAKPDNALFLSPFTGKRICYQLFDRLAGEYARRAGIVKQVSCHTLRHACAVHLLEGGADIRSIQELLGHRSIESTEIYLSLSKEQLKKVHKKSHPRGIFPNPWE